LPLCRPDPQAMFPLCRPDPQAMFPLCRPDPQAMFPHCRPDPHVMFPLFRPDPQAMFQLKTLVLTICPIFHFLKCAWTILEHCKGSSGCNSWAMFLNSAIIALNFPRGCLCSHLHHQQSSHSCCCACKTLTPPISLLEMSSVRHLADLSLCCVPSCQSSHLHPTHTRDVTKMVLDVSLLRPTIYGYIWLLSFKPCAEIAMDSI